MILLCLKRVPHGSFDLPPAVRKTADLASSRMRLNESDGNGSRTPEYIGACNLIRNIFPFPEGLTTENVRECDRSELNRHRLRSQRSS